MTHRTISAFGALFTIASAFLCSCLAISLHDRGEAVLAIGFLLVAILCAVAGVAYVIDLATTREAK